MRSLTNPSRARTARPASFPVQIVHFDRVEWHVQPDPATKSAAFQAGEMDWWKSHG